MAERIKFNKYVTFHSVIIQEFASESVQNQPRLKGAADSNMHFISLYCYIKIASFIYLLNYLLPLQILYIET